MRNFVIATLSVLLISTQAQAQCQEQMKTCRDAIKEADGVIAKQGELILLVKTRNDELMDENAELSKAIVTLKRENDKYFERQLVYGSAGLVIGILATLLVTK